MQCHLYDITEWQNKSLQTNLGYTTNLQGSLRKGTLLSTPYPKYGDKNTHPLYRAVVRRSSLMYVSHFESAIIMLSIIRWP